MARRRPTDDAISFNLNLLCCLTGHCILASEMNDERLSTRDAEDLHVLKRGVYKRSFKGSTVTEVRRLATLRQHHLEICSADDRLSSHDWHVGMIDCLQRKLFVHIQIIW